jgi:hypothetical protein
VDYGSKVRTDPADDRHRARCARGSGAPRGKLNGSYKHGLFTVEAFEERRLVQALLAELRALADELPRD